MSNRIYRINIIKPEFEKLYKKYELLAHGLEEIAKYSKKEKKVKLNDSGPATEKTSTDYVVEALNYFKDEYNKARLTGIIYEYNLGPNFSLSDYEPKSNEINHAFYRAKAIEQLHKVGFVKNYTIENRAVDDYGNVDDYAICEIDESKITQKEAPPATEAGVEALTQTVIHKHFFENSIQEKGIDLNHKYDKDEKTGFYITKKGDDFIYKGKTLDLSKNNDYYKVFCALYATRSEGGEIKYKELITEIKSRMPEVKSKTESEMRKFIQANLTDKSNGFVRYAEIPKTEDAGKPLIKIIHNFGVRFNNKIG